MSEGFDNGKVKVEIYQNEVDKLLKNYKKIKKYMKSSLYEIKKIDGTEKVVSELLKEYEDNPLN
jgi:DNA integrity scanning protein DisA with diadenylate cyclase activity